MNRGLGVALAATLALSGAGLVGCTGMGDAGMGEGAEVWGYVASADDAQLEVAADQTGVDAVVVDLVRVPEDAWIIVHLDQDGMPGERVGLLGVQKGESHDVSVKLDGVTTDQVVVAVHADRGERGTVEFDMMNKETSPDRPFFVGGKELAAVVTVR